MAMTGTDHTAEPPNEITFSFSSHLNKSPWHSWPFDEKWMLSYPVPIDIKTSLH